MSAVKVCRAGAAWFRDKGMLNWRLLRPTNELRVRWSTRLIDQLMERVGTGESVELRGRDWFRTLQRSKSVHRSGREAQLWKWREGTVGGPHGALSTDNSSRHQTDCARGGDSSRETGRVWICLQAAAWGADDRAARSRNHRVHWWGVWNGRSVWWGENEKYFWWVYSYFSFSPIEPVILKKSFTFWTSWLRDLKGLATILAHFEVKLWTKLVLFCTDNKFGAWIRC